MWVWSQTGKQTMNKKNFCKSNYEYNESDALSKLARERKELLFVASNGNFYEQHSFQNNIFACKLTIKVLFCTSKER